MTNTENSDAEIMLLKLLEASIAERNNEYRVLISEIARLQLIKITLKGEPGETVFVPGVTAGR